MAVYDLDDPARLPGVLAVLGATVDDMVGGGEPRLGGLDPGDLTVTIGVGPRLVRTVDPGLPGALDLPEFAREAIQDTMRQGDLMVQVCASDPLVVSTAEVTLFSVLGSAGGRLRWTQRGFRPPAGGHRVGRNLLGFLDGIVVPRTADEMRVHVWLDGPEPVAGGTIAVVRRLRIDLPRFHGLPVERQEQVIGRRRADGTPLTGGRPEDHVDLGAKTPDGRYVVAHGAHVRRSNPNSSGSGTMLRRSYSYDNGPDDAGLLFVSFQRQLRTFVATQHRLDEADDLMDFTTATASATFLVLPGATTDAPLGQHLFG